MTGATKYLITGAGGFLGRHLAARVVAGGGLVSCIGHHGLDEQTAVRQGIARWLNADVSVAGLSALNGDEPTTIFHCAGGSSVARSVENPYVDFQRTVGGMSEVLEYMRLYNPHARLVFLSSAAVYGDASAPICAEDASLCPVSPYGVHKLQAEQLCRLYAQQYGIKIAIVRLFSVYGQGLRKQLIWDACVKLLSNPQVEFWGTGAETRDWLHVDDAISLLVEVGAVADVSCPIYNGGTGQPVQVRQILAQLMELLGLRGEPQFNGRWKAGDPQHLVAATVRANALGWHPRMPLKRGLTQYVDWALRHQP